MATRALAASVLIASGVIAWLAVTWVVAARLLQVAIGLSILYVAYLAVRGLAAFRAALRASEEDAPGTEDPVADRPFISVVVAARDEASVIGDLIDDLVRQTYAWPDGRPAFEIVIADGGSTDDTVAIAQRSAAAGGAPDGMLQAVLVEPGAGPQTKGNALAEAMPHLRGEVVAVLDADTRVEPRFLARLMAAWSRDAGAVAIQARRRPLNAGRSWLTAAQAEEQLMDLASQCGRRSLNGTAELRGNGMAVRLDALDRVGGWGRWAITEDLELSTRLAAAGEHVALAPEVVVGEEAVEDLGALWRQRSRWAEGSLRRLMRHAPRMLAGDASTTAKLDFLAFASEFVIPPLFATSIVASLLTIPLPPRMDWTVPVSLFVGYGLGSFLLALAGLAAVGDRGMTLLGRALRGALFLSHWLLVVPVVLVRIAVAEPTVAFHKTPRASRRAQP
jgi:1,2-diacylglycerol 3-beta-glucosyltransferase